MSAKTGAGWRAFLWIAALYNLIIGIAVFLDAQWGSAEATNGALIFAFGIVYALTAREPARFAPVLLAGIFGKAMVVAMLGPPNWRAGGDPALAAIVAGDLAFAIGFLVFLLRARRHG